MAPYRCVKGLTYNKRLIYYITLQLSNNIHHSVIAPDLYQFVLHDTSTLLFGNRVALPCDNIALVCHIRHFLVDSETRFNS